MKHFRRFWIVATLYSALVPCGAILRLNAQTDDWRVVQRIAPGSYVSIGASNHRGRLECELLQVTASDLTCEIHRGMFHKQRIFLRDEIREIRLELPEHHHMILGGIIGGAVGAAIGGLLAGRTRDPETRVADPPFGALVGVSLGAGVGRGIHQHGPVLYRRK